MVTRIPLRRHADERGWFTELMRASKLPKPIRQANLAHSRRGVIRALQQLQRVVDHRPVADRQEVLVRDARQLFEARRVAAGGDEPFHAGDPTASRATWPRAAASPRIPATTPTVATAVHITLSP